MKKIITICLLALGFGFLNCPPVLAADDEISAIDIAAFLAEEANSETIAKTDYSNINDAELLQSILDQLTAQLENLTAQINKLK